MKDPEHDLNAAEGSDIRSWEWLAVTLLTCLIWLLMSLELLWHRLRNWAGMHSVCAWCRGHIAGNRFASTKTHGMCPKCFTKHMAEIEQPLNK